MSRNAVTLALLVSSSAFAQDFEAESAIVSFRGSEGVVNQQRELPLVIDVGFIVDHFGVVATVTGGSNLLLEMEGESRVAWPDPTGAGDVVHRIEPLANGSRLAMTAEVDIGVDFVLGVLNNDFSFSLLSRSLVFEPEITGFTPFLLLDQTPNEMTIDATPTSGGFDLPFNWNVFDAGVIAVSLGVLFTATPETFSTVSGIALSTEHDGETYTHNDPTIPNSVWLYENTGSMEMESTYEVDVETEIGYRFVGSGGLTVSILGSDIPITVEFLNQYIELFRGSERPVYTSGTYNHDLPVAATPIEAIDFGVVEEDTSQTFTFPLNNDGLMELEGLVTFEGDVEFAVAPPDLFADAGGQDAAIITFSPMSSGDFSGTLILNTSDPLRPEVRIPVTGSSVKKQQQEGPDPENPDPQFNNNGGSSIYTACGCAGSGAGGLGWLAVLTPLVLARRRAS